ncbi:MAG: hypothetical protein QXR27_04570 [Archaeoglobaceae archaeon]
MLCSCGRISEFKCRRCGKNVCKKCYFYHGLCVECWKKIRS